MCYLKIPDDGSFFFFFFFWQSLETLKFWLGWPRNTATSSIREDRSVIVIFIDGCSAEQLVMLSNPVTSSDKNNSPSPKTHVINGAAPKTHYKRVSFCATLHPCWHSQFSSWVDYYWFIIIVVPLRRNVTFSVEKRLLRQSVAQILPLLNFLIKCF